MVSARRHSVGTIRSPSQTCTACSAPDPGPQGWFGPRRHRRASARYQMPHPPRAAHLIARRCGVYRTTGCAGHAAISSDQQARRPLTADYNGGEKRCLAQLLKCDAWPEFPKDCVEIGEKYGYLNRKYSIQDEARHAHSYLTSQCVFAT